MSNKNEVFEYLIDQLRQQVNNNQCEDLAHEVQSLKNQLRDALERETELQKALNLLGRQVSILANKFAHEPEQSGCRKEGAQLPVCSCVPAHCGTYNGDTVVCDNCGGVITE